MGQKLVVLGPRPSSSRQDDFRDRKVRALSAPIGQFDPFCGSPLHLAPKPPHQPLRPPPEVVVRAEPLVRVHDPEQFLLLRPQRVEDRLAVAFAVDQEVAAKLGHQRRHAHRRRVRQRCLLVEAEAGQLAQTLVQKLGRFRGVAAERLPPSPK